MKDINPPSIPNTKPDASPMPPTRALPPPGETWESYNERLNAALLANFKKNVRK